jgi:RNA polymerase sigma factor (TIGR02999 family)
VPFGLSALQSENVQSDPVTLLLENLRNGDKTALNALLPIVYGELRRLAGTYFRRERPDHTLQPTVLIHEAYLRLLGQGQPGYQNRSHFYAVAGQVMRQILVDHARTRNATKRGGGLRPAPLPDEGGPAMKYSPVDMIALDDALSALEKLDERKARLIEMRFIAGLSVEEAAEVSGLSAPSVYRELRLAQAWLKTHLQTAN